MHHMCASPPLPAPAAPQLQILVKRSHWLITPQILLARSQICRSDLQALPSSTTSDARSMSRSKSSMEKSGSAGVPPVTMAPRPCATADASTTSPASPSWPDEAPCAPLPEVESLLMGAATGCMWVPPISAITAAPMESKSPSPPRAKGASGTAETDTLGGVLTSGCGEGMRAGWIVLRDLRVEPGVALLERGGLGLGAPAAPARALVAVEGVEAATAAAAPPPLLLGPDAPTSAGPPCLPLPLLLAPAPLVVLVGAAGGSSVLSLGSGLLLWMAAVEGASTATSSASV
mmetsp:Transcript_33046/g.83877  ORF Transcript_33046/g.83877 Transcript_33046/m.83877 type:complete len:289 (-) Transcript_33046:1300-2166(-)